MLVGLLTSASQKRQRAWLSGCCALARAQRDRLPQGRGSGAPRGGVRPFSLSLSASRKCLLK